MVLGIGVVFGIIYLNFWHYLTLEKLNQHRDFLEQYYQNNTFLMIFLFFIFYVVATSISIPGALIFTVTAGFIFGRINGTLIVSFASTLGATISFVLARFILGDLLQEKYGQQLKTINLGVEKDGFFYLLSLRLIPLFPFFMVNLLMGMTKIKTWKYALISQIGMLPGTFVYVNAGTALSNINKLKDIFSIQLFGSFVLLGLFPLIVKFVMALVHK